jgi:hypothetical protein
MRPEQEAVVDEVRHSNRSPEEALYRAERAIFFAPILFGETTIGQDRTPKPLSTPTHFPPNPAPLKERLAIRFPDWAKRRGLL